MDSSVKKRVQKVLKKVMQHEIAESFFNEPVDPDALGIPEYRDIVQNPMDLGTVSQRLESNFYASASAVADDICLVWHNCRAFNEPGSDVFQSCDELSGFFDQQWKQAKLPPPTGKNLSNSRQDDGWPLQDPSILTPPDAYLAGMQDDKGLPNGSSKKGKQPALRQGQRGMHGSAPDLNGGSFALSPAEINSLRQGHPLLRCLNVLNHVMHQPAAAPFCSQDAGFMAYFHMTGEKPVDLSIIRSRLLPGTTQGWGTIEYKSTAEVLADVRRVWDSYRSSYDPTDPVVGACDIVERAFNYAWMQAGFSLENAGQQPGDVLRAPRQSFSDDEQKRGQPVIKQRSDGKPERSTAKKFKTTMQIHGESDSEEQAISTDSEEQKRWRPQPTSGRCAVCKRAKKGRCGTETAPAKCEKRIENMRKSGSERAAGHPLQNSLPSKQSLKRKNSWDLDEMPGLQGSFLPGDSPTLRFSSNPDQFSRLPGGMRVDDPDSRVLAEWQQVLRARQEAAHAVEAANRAVAQVHQAEAALRAAMQYDEALARNKAAAKTGLSGWLPDARGAPPGYTPISPMMSRPQLLNPEVAAVGSYWVGQGPDMDGDKHRPNGVKTGTAMPGAGLNLQQRIAQYHQEQQQRAQAPLGSPRGSGQQPGQHAQRLQQAPITPQQGLHGRSSGSLPPASSPQNPLASLPRDTLQPPVTSGYTPTSAPQTGYGAPSHNIHSMSGPVTGVPGQKLPSASTAPPKPATPSWPEGNRMQQQPQQPPVSASALQQAFSNFEGSVPSGNTVRTGSLPSFSPATSSPPIIESPSSMQRAFSASMWDY